MDFLLEAKIKSIDEIQRLRKKGIGRGINIPTLMYDFIKQNRDKKLKFGAYTSQDLDTTFNALREATSRRIFHICWLNITRIFEERLIIARIKHKNPRPFAPFTVNRYKNLELLFLKPECLVKVPHDPQFRHYKCLINGIYFKRDELIIKSSEIDNDSEIDNEFNELIEGI
jgi:hypothetical protein